MKFIFVFLSILALCLETLQLSTIEATGKRDTENPDRCLWDGHVLKEGDNQILDDCLLIDCQRGLSTILGCPPTKNRGCKPDITKKFPLCCC